MLGYSWNLKVQDPPVPPPSTHQELEGDMKCEGMWFKLRCGEGLREEGKLQGMGRNESFRRDGVETRGEKRIKT